MADDSDKTAVLQGDPETLRKEIEEAKQQDACLIVIRGARQGHRFFITQDEMVMGRDPAAQISIPEQSVSRRHAQLARSGNSVTVTDLGSSNGTQVNGKKIKSGDPVPLAKEDMVKIGNCILKFLPAGELEILFYGNLDSAAHTDPLTKTYNKGYLLEVLEAEVKRAKGLHQDFTVLFFDLDHFKNVNDTHGHDAGDFVLKEFSRIIKKKHIRENDIFARYGGEEFVILLSNTAADAGLEIAEGIRASIEAHPFIYEGTRIPITTSIGIAELTAEIESPQTLLKLADQGLYKAKEAGRNRVALAN